MIFINLVSLHRIQFVLHGLLENIFTRNSKPMQSILLIKKQRKKRKKCLSPVFLFAVVLQGFFAFFGVASYG
jgi:hypothetical protein